MMHGNFFHFNKVGPVPQKRKQLIVKHVIVKDAGDGFLIGVKAKQGLVFQFLVHGKTDTKILIVHQTQGTDGTGMGMQKFFQFFLG